MRLATVTLLFIGAAGAFAQSDDELFHLMRVGDTMGIRQRRAPELDPKRIINESNSFLKDKEPEMTAEEYALYEKAQTLLASNPAFAVTLLEAMMDDKEKPSPAFEFILGNAYYAAGEIDKSEARYQGAVARYPTFLRAWSNLGILYYTNSRYEEAVRTLSRAIALGDRESTTYGLLAYSLEQLGNDVAAEVTYMQALSGAPTDVDWQEGLLRMCLKSRQLVRAESIARTLVNAHPQEARYWLILANVLLTSSRPLEAAAVLETAAGAGVANPEDLILLGDIYAEHNMHGEALAIYSKLLRPSPEIGEDKLLRLAETLVGAGRDAEASSVLAVMPARLSPKGTSRKLLIQARIASASEKWDDARGMLQALLADEPLNGDGLLALARIDVAAGDDAHASLVLETATRVPQAAYRAHLELANLELRQRQYSRSVTHLEAALQIERSQAVADHLARVRALAGEGDGLELRSVATGAAASQSR